MTVLWLMVNPTETLSQKATVFFISKYKKCFYKVQQFYYKVPQNRDRHTNPRRKFNFRCGLRKVSLQYRHTQISFPTAGL